MPDEVQWGVSNISHQVSRYSLRVNIPYAMTISEVRLSLPHCVLIEQGCGVYTVIERVTSRMDVCVCVVLFLAGLVWPCRREGAC